MPTDTPEYTVTLTPTDTDTETPTVTPSASKTATSTKTLSPTKTYTRTPSNTRTPTKTPTVFNGTGLLAQYFVGQDLTNQAFSRVDPMIRFQWYGFSPEGYPDGAQYYDNFSVRWTGWVKPVFTDDYTFHVECDDGVKIYIDDVLILDSWNYSPYGRTSSPVHLIAGTWHKIKIEYREITGSAYIFLRWYSAQQKMDFVPPNNLMPCTLGGEGCPPIPTPTVTQTFTRTLSPTKTPTLPATATGTRTPTATTSTPAGQVWKLAPHRFRSTGDLSGAER